MKSNSAHFSILFFGTQMAFGGAQKLLLDQANWFHVRGYKVTAAFFYDKENLRDKWQANADFPVYVMASYRRGLGKWKSASELLKGLWSLWKLLRQEHFDVVQSFTHDSNTLVLPLAWLAGVPVRLATHHGLADQFPRWRERLHTWLINHALANTLVVVSARTYQSALREGVRVERMVIIKNGIRPLSVESVDRLKVREEAGLQDGDIFLVSVGRLVYEKAHNVLLNAMPFILEKYPNVKVGIVGDGVLRTQLEAQIEELGITHSVRLFGMSDSVLKYLAIAQAFVLPSRSEGLPIALLEAMSAGLPVVVTDLDGMDDVVRRGEDGFLVPVEDARALANAILQLLSDPARARQMGIAARKHVMENYTEDIMGEQYLALMKKYLETSKSE